jgi:hypothetical protein
MPAERRSLLLLAAFVVLVVLAFSLFPKKFNRYLVLAFPALDILAAAGLVWTIGALARGRVYLQRALLAGVALLAWLNAAAWHPYSIAAFNQALGGAEAGARTFSVGWGEGFGQAAAWLNEQPDITGVQTAAIMIRSLQPYLRHGAQATTPEGPTLPPETGYVVVYIYQAQGTVFAPFDEFYPQATPLHTVTIHGVEYAWIYQAPPRLAHPLDVGFGGALRLRGYEASGPLQPGATTTLRLAWQAETPASIDYWLFAHLLNAQGERVAQVDLPLPTSAWEPPRTYLSELPLTLPADAPPGTYRLLLGLYDPASGERLSLAPDHAADPALSGPHALPLTRLEVAE